LNCGKGYQINFWNDLWCSPNMYILDCRGPYQDRIHFSFKVVDGWNGFAWNIYFVFCRLSDIYHMNNLVLSDMSDLPN